MNNNQSNMNKSNNRTTFNTNQKSFNELVNKASQKLGTSPQNLKNQIENGKLDNILKSLPPQQAKMFQTILKNPEMAKKLMDTPQAKSVMQKFFNQK